jgi:hypothetical protein
VTTTSPVSPSILYLETTIPEGQTITEYRRSRPQRLRGWRRLRHLGRTN